MTEIAVAEIELPESSEKNRLVRTPRSEAPDDFASAADRIAAFWEKYPEGSILPEVEVDTVDDGEHLPYRVYTVRAFIRKHSDSERPDAIAHATRSDQDEDEVTRAFPQETAETSAVSRALRYLGILPHGKPADTAPRAAPKDAPTALPPLAAARKAKAWSQKTLSTAMVQRGHDWTQATVSKAENGHRALQDEEVASLAELIGYGGDS